MQEENLDAAWADHHSIDAFLGVLDGTRGLDGGEDPKQSTFVIMNHEETICCAAKRQEKETRYFFDWQSTCDWKFTKMEFAKQAPGGKIEREELAPKGAGSKYASEANGQEVSLEAGMFSCEIAKEVGDDNGDPHGGGEILRTKGALKGSPKNGGKGEGGPPQGKSDCRRRGASPRSIPPVQKGVD